MNHRKITHSQWQKYLSWETLKGKKTRQTSVIYWSVKQVQWIYKAITLGLYYKTALKAVAYIVAELIQICPLMADSGLLLRLPQNKWKVLPRIECFSPQKRSFSCYTEQPLVSVRISSEQSKFAATGVSQLLPRMTLRCCPENLLEESERRLLHNRLSAASCYPEIV